MVFHQGYARGAWNFRSRTWERAMKGLAKPAELGIFALVALYAVRQAFRSEWVRTRVRSLLRLLQVIHVPLGIVVFASAAIHGLLFLLYRWKSDLHAWSGVAALAMMAIAVVAGLFTIPRPARKETHLILGLTTFCISLIHIFTAG
jgi:hypothetical protein